ncbi:MAG: serine acetyltransferase [Methylobacter sp.]
MFEHIRADTIRAHQITRGERLVEKLSALDVFRALWQNYGLQALVVYRFGRWLNQLRDNRYGRAGAVLLYPLYALLAAAVRKTYGIDLDQSADIAPGLYIGHFGGIEVRNCRIGPRCNIHHQVKLGTDDTVGKGPVIGSGVWIGAHTRICSRVIIEDGATIGAGAVVLQDIPHHCVVLGNPGRIAQREFDNNAFL